MLRKAKRADVVEIHRIRMSVHENRLVSRIITEDETIEAIEETGRGWVIEENGEIVSLDPASIAPRRHCTEPTRTHHPNTRSRRLLTTARSPPQKPRPKPIRTGARPHPVRDAAAEN
jgi:hypothetical protein